MLTIRLKPLPRKAKSFFRIVVTDSKKKLSAPSLDTLGYWQPPKNKISIDQEKLKIWREKGAKISTAVRKLLEK